MILVIVDRSDWVTEFFNVEVVKFNTLEKAQSYAKQLSYVDSIIVDTEEVEQL